MILELFCEYLKYELIGDSRISEKIFGIKRWVRTIGNKGQDWGKLIFAQSYNIPTAANKRQTTTPIKIATNTTTIIFRKPFSIRVPKSNSSSIIHIIYYNLHIKA